MAEKHRNEPIGPVLARPTKKEAAAEQKKA
jgi:hypothetical protein